MRASRPWSTEHTGDRHGGCHHRIAPQAILTQRPRAGVTMLAAAERTTDRRAEQHPSVRSQQKLALGGQKHRTRGPTRPRALASAEADAYA
jgi:hypothetical protein